MRASFAEQLDDLRGQMVVMAASVTSAIRWASESLLETDLDAATRVLRAADEIAQARQDLDTRVYRVLARQQPVASDLRLALASLQVVGDIERMGVLAAHISKIMLRRHPVVAVPQEATDTVRAMGEIAERMAWKLTRLLEVADLAAARELERDDDEMDALHRRMFEGLLRNWSHGVQAAVDAALLARFYERYADHAVNTGRHVAFLITGQRVDAATRPDSTE